MPPCLVAREVASTCSVPAASTTIVVRRVSPAGIVTSVGRAPWTGSVPVRCRWWTGVAEDPLVVDRVLVPQHDRHRHADRYRELRRLEVRVADVDGQLGRRRRAAGHGPGRRRARHSERDDDPEEQPEVGPPHGSNLRQRPTRAASGRAGAGRRPQDDHAEAEDQPKRLVRRQARRRDDEPGIHVRRRAGAAGVDREVERELRGGGIDAHLRQPRRIRDPFHAPVGLQVGQQRFAGRLVVEQGQPVVAGRCGSSAGRWSLRRYTSASTRSSPVLPSARIRSGTHGLSVGIVTWTGVPSPTAWPRSAAASASNTAARKIGDRSA